LSAISVELNVFMPDVSLDDVPTPIADGPVEDSYVFITTTQALADYCAIAANADFLCVDFEFMREHTYYSQLCLIQLATPHGAAVVDPLSKTLDLAPLLHLLLDHPILKVFHAGGQDIEIIHNIAKRTPFPVFDSQIAAMALGHGEQISYQNLIQNLLRVTIDKGARFTDWSRRPLDKRQLDYAVGDVTYLAKAFPILLDGLRSKDRGDWLDEEMQRLADPATYRNDPDLAWRRIRLPSRDAKVLGRLKALAAWREQEAAAKDLPRQRLVKDETLADIAGHPPKSQNDLARIRGLSEKWASNDVGARLFEAVSKASALPREEMPDRNDGPKLDKHGRIAADLLKMLQKFRSDDMDVAPKLICRSDEMERLAAGERDLPVLKSWRYDVFGKDALDVIEGRVAFHIRNGRLVIRQIEIEAIEEASDDIAV
jgi:ribonuclease D